MQKDTDKMQMDSKWMQGSGCVEFEEFLQWFHSHFLKEKPPARSLHSGTLQFRHDTKFVAFQYVPFKIHQPSSALAPSATAGWHLFFDTKTNVREHVTSYAHVSIRHLYGFVSKTYSWKYDLRFKQLQSGV